MMRLIKKSNYTKYLLICILKLCFSCNSNTKSDEIIVSNGSSTISFTKNFVDLGKIPANKDAMATFNFSNIGKHPLVISEIKTSCGCTTPKYPEDVIKPNENGTIKVVYDAKYPGRFNKTITVYYNGKDSPKTLTIKGSVPYPKGLDSIVN